MSFSAFSRRQLKRLAIFPFAIAAVALLYLLLMPDISTLKTENPRRTSFMDLQQHEAKRKGKPFNIYQVWVPLARISPTLIKAVLIAEDDKFWSHEGFDYEAIKKALEKDIRSGKFRLGGSTISQQLARNLYLTPEKSLLRKAREALITWRMERVLSKKRILELYLNVAEWGEGIYGVEAASRHYYGKASSELTPEESARLAAVLPHPRKYRPTGSQTYVVHRSELIYDIMVRRGIVVPEYPEAPEAPEARDASQEQLSSPFHFSWDGHGSSH
jgi:monofunctional biosynthetic peptidoglycan transglycosylase